MFVCKHFSVNTVVMFILSLPSVLHPLPRYFVCGVLVPDTLLLVHLYYTFED